MSVYIVTRRYEWGGEDEARKGRVEEMERNFDLGLNGFLYSPFFLAKSNYRQAMSPTMVDLCLVVPQLSSDRL
jgi:hypothetical protein